MNKIEYLCFGQQIKQMRLKSRKIRKFIVPIGRRQLDSEGSIKYDENPEEEAGFQEATSVMIVQSLAEKIKWVLAWTLVIFTISLF